MNKDCAIRDKKIVDAVFGFLMFREATRKDSCGSWGRNPKQKAGCVRATEYTFTTFIMDCGLGGHGIATPRIAISPSNPVNNNGGISGVNTNHVSNPFPMIKINDNNPNFSDRLNPFITTPALPKPLIASITPCEQLVKLAETGIGNTSVKSMVDKLKQRVNSAINNVEDGFETKKETTYDPITDKETNVYTSEYTIGQNMYFNDGVIDSYTVGQGHNHPKNGVPMFSFSDVFYLAENYRVTRTENKQEVFQLLVCKNQVTDSVKTYVIKIDNYKALKDKIDTKLNKYDNIYSLKEKLNFINIILENKYNKSDGDYEKTFLIQFIEFGISLYEATDDTLTNWEKKELSADSGQTEPIVKSKPCN